MVTENDLKICSQKSSAISCGHLAKLSKTWAELHHSICSVLHPLQWHILGFAHLPGVRSSDPTDGSELGLKEGGKDRCVWAGHRRRAGGTAPLPLRWKDTRVGRGIPSVSSTNTTTPGFGVSNSSYRVNRGVHEPPRARGSW